MLFFHISRENIILEGKGFSEILEYENIERTLASTLLEIIERYSISRIRVLNGPGGFTFLRLGCLAVNMLKSLSNIPLKIYECSKLDVYRYAIDQGFLPNIGVVFMGQRKKLWRILLDKKIGGGLGKNGFYIDVLREENIKSFLQDTKEYFIDPCEHILLDYLDINNMIEMNFSGEMLSLYWKEKTLTLDIKDLGLPIVESLEPKYMMKIDI